MPRRPSRYVLVRHPAPSPQLACDNPAYERAECDWDIVARTTFLRIPIPAAGVLP